MGRHAVQNCKLKGLSLQQQLNRVKPYSLTHSVLARMFAFTYQLKSSTFVSYSCAYGTMHICFYLS